MWDRRTDADRADFSEAVQGRPDAQELTDAFMAMRRASFVSVAASVRERGKSSPQSSDSDPYEILFRKIPIEFALYSCGAAAYRDGDYDLAIAEFSKVLALPAAQRRYRSVWAAFMLGRSWLRKEPEKAIPFFEQCRDLATKGFRDQLGLAQDSLGWQALAELETRHYTVAMHHYAEQGKANPDHPEGAIASLETVCRRALGEETVDTALVQDPLCCQLITAWIVSRGKHNYEGERAKWLVVVAQAKPEGIVPGADQLAWMTYETGDMQAAAQWLEHCDANAPYGNWVRAKLLLREGKIEEGEALLKQLASSFPRGRLWDVQDPSHMCWTQPIPSINLVLAQLGSVLLDRGDYPGALLAFARGDWDGRESCLVEQVMTPDEVEQFIAAHSDDPGLVTTCPGSGRTVNHISTIQNLLARRWARMGEWGRAVPMYPSDNRNRTHDRLQVLAREYVDHLASAHDETLSPQTRAQHFFDAGRIMWADGESLIAPEYDPEYPSLVESHSQPGLAERVASSRACYPKRHYYRFVAADLMWQCAELLPRNDVLAAHALFLGGSYIKARDPGSADKFYKALVRRNPNLLIARQADELRWFPKTFTDTVLYQPLPKHWYGSKRRLAAVTLALMAVFAVVLAGAIWNRARKARVDRGKGGEQQAGT